jgi:hypothetical protein
MSFALKLEQTKIKDLGEGVGGGNYKLTFQKINKLKSWKDSTLVKR